MTGPSPDLDALREKAEKATPGPWLQDDLDGCRLIADDAAREDSTADVAEFWIIEDAEYIAAVSPDVLLAVLSLVDDLRAENERYARALCEIANGDYYGPAEDRALLALGGDDEEASP